MIRSYRVRTIPIRTRIGAAAAFAVAFGLFVPVGTLPVAATVVQPGFQVATLAGGLNTPTALAFAPNGRLFVTERGGRILTFDSTSDSTPTTVADLSAQVHAVADRGLLGLAVDPEYPTRPYVYVLYIVDAKVGGTGSYGDRCPFSPDGAKDGCPAAGRLSRITVGSDGRMVGTEHVLVGGGFWCHQQQAHAVDHVEFGPDGALYASAGEGATASFTDWGQHSGAADAIVPPNACGDPPAPAGQALSLPTTEGGALRAQDLRTPGDPAGGSGAIIRIDPDTGAAMPDNPLVGNGVASDDRHIAYGLRNPFRFTFRPGTDEIWIGDVGWNSWEEVNRIADSRDAIVENFGWPCYEGAAKQAAWNNLGVDMCRNLYAAGAGAVRSPYWAYRHDASPDPNRCGNAGSATSGIAFSRGDPYPDTYDGSLFVADYTKGCVWALLAGANGLPDPASVRTVLSNVFATDLEVGPGGNLYYVDIAAGTLNRLDYFSANEPPIAAITATPTYGALPLAVQFDARGSTDDTTTSLGYAWDLDGDGAFDDGTGPTRQWTYQSAVNVTARVRVTDGQGAASTASVTIYPGNRPPTASILAPTTSLRWAAGDTVAFSGSASDPDQTMPQSSMRWTLILQHCANATDCHAHPQREWVGVDGGSFSAPEHEYPAHLELRLTVQDSRGMATTVSRRLDPATVSLTFGTRPTGLQLTVGDRIVTAPSTVTAIVGSRVSVSAQSPQTLARDTLTFSAWSDGGAASHDIVPGRTDATYIATFVGRTGFSDTAWSPFQTEIRWLFEQGITGGCGETTFCPLRPVTRAQMASFLVRALDPPATQRDFFADDDASIHESDINRLAAAGITGGCGERRYCPGQGVSRAEMASFLARAFQLPTTTTNPFRDDDASMHESNINRLAAAKITGGCAPGLYCPASTVNREQMAAFLYRAMR